MLEKQPKHHNFLDPQEHGSIVDSRPWLSEGPRRSSSSSSSTVAPGNDGNVDKVLFRNLVEIVPLVESLMDKRANSSFTRRASLIITPTPAAQPKKNVQPKGRKIGHTLSSKKGRDLGENASNLHIKSDNQDGGTDDFSLFTRQLEAETAQKDREEVTILRQQLEELQKKISEKDEILKSTENSLNQMSSVYATVDELKRQVSDKESSVKSTQSQLYNAQIKLADKQAALEKLEWEARTSNIKTEKLQGDLDSIEFQMTAFMRLFEELVNCEPAASVDENITVFHHFDNLSNIDFDENGAEDARKAYVAALSAAKENPSDESIASAAAARLRLQAFVL